LKQEYSARRKSELRISGSDSSSWPTARATDGAKGGPNQHGSKGDLTLPSAAVQWPTPASRDYKGGADWSKRTRNGKPRLESTKTLPDVAEYWPTPSASTYGSNQGGSGGRSGPIRPSLQSLATQQGGPKCRMMLNPLFVEMLMGLPPHWTCVCPSSAIGRKHAEEKKDS
jgi:hypothetical protein